MSLLLLINRLQEVGKNTISLSIVTKRYNVLLTIDGSRGQAAGRRGGGSNCQHALF